MEAHQMVGKSRFVLGVIVLAGLIGGCSSTSVPSGTGGGGGGGLGGAGGPRNCDGDLTGTWDLYASSLTSGSVGGVLVVSSAGFDVTTSGGHLVYTAQGSPSATWTTSAGTRPIAVQNNPVDVNGGSIPVAFGGHWMLASGVETCTLDVVSGSAAGTCQAAPGDRVASGRDWPYATVPNLENGLHYLVSRTSTLASQFGDYGGVWTARSDTGSGQGCSITLDGNTITTSCHASNDFNGVMHLTIGSDCVASGTTPSGLEVSARRR
jgi:hypothetical protein